MARSRNLPNGETKGRLPRLNETVAQALLKALSNGAYIITACQFVGVARMTYVNWLDRGDKEIGRVRRELPDVEERLAELTELQWPEFIAARFEPFHEAEWPFVAFRLLTARARATAELRALTEIQKAGMGSPNKEGQWTAYAWFLERSFPEKYGRRNQVKLEGNKDGDPIQIESVSVDAVEEAIGKLRDEL